MKIGRKGLAVVCLLVCLGLIIFFYRPRASESAKLATFGPEGSPPPARPMASPIAAANVRTVIPSAAETKQRDEQRIRMSYLTPVSVYGKVVDENGNPIPGATIEIGIADNPLGTGSKYVQTTDANGLFTLASRGIAFSMRASKDGYYSTNESTGHRNVVVPAEGDTAQPTEDRPAILILHKQGETERLISTNTGQIVVPKTGQAVTIDLTTGQVGQGDLVISSWIGDESLLRYDWRYQLSVVGGGIIERTGRFDFEAPADGYQATAEVSMLATAEKWSIGAEREYFARLSDGRYARFLVRFYPRKRNFVVLESFVNPIPGRRNLEFDPDKKIMLP